MVSFKKKKKKGRQEEITSEKSMNQSKCVIVASFKTTASLRVLVDHINPIVTQCTIF